MVISVKASQFQLVPTFMNAQSKDYNVGQGPGSSA